MLAYTTIVFLVEFYVNIGYVRENFEIVEKFILVFIPLNRIRFEVDVRGFSNR